MLDGPFAPDYSSVTMAEDGSQRIIDRNDIIDTINNYAFGVDLRDWDLYRSIFADEFEADLTSLGAPEPQLVKVDDWVARVRDGLSGYKGTQHIMSNHRVTVEGDEARTAVYFQATHYLPNDQGDNHWTIGGYYEHTLMRTAQGWKIRKLKLTVTWNEGNRGLQALAAQAWQAAQSGDDQPL